MYGKSICAVAWHAQSCYAVSIVPCCMDLVDEEVKQIHATWQNNVLSSKQLGKKTMRELPELGSMGGTFDTQLAAAIGSANIARLAEDDRRCRLGM